MSMGAPNQTKLTSECKEISLLLFSIFLFGYTVSSPNLATSAIPCWLMPIHMTSVYCLRVIGPKQLLHNSLLFLNKYCRPDNT